jgi:lipopolysaccharide/colanic/teichoic acid biosynthesis glycosyltransferase
MSTRILLLGAQPDPERYYREVVLPDKLRLNVEYLNRVSFFYDALLVLRTARAIFSSTSIPEIQ